jgi:hypothetical protein
MKDKRIIYKTIDVIHFLPLFGMQKGRWVTYHMSAHLSWHANAGLN